MYSSLFYSVGKPDSKGSNYMFKATQLVNGRDRIASQSDSRAQGLSTPPHCCPVRVAYIRRPTPASVCGVT